MRCLIEAAQPAEHWELVQTPSGDFYVGWRLDKDAINRRRHQGLSLRHGIPVIANPDNTVEIVFEEGEEREKVIGRGADGTPLVVACSWVETGEAIPAVRIISVRRAEPYELSEGVFMDEDVKQQPVDPDNPPLQGKGQRMRWGDRIAQKVAAQKAKYQAKVAASSPSNKGETNKTR